MKRYSYQSRTTVFSKQNCQKYQQKNSDFILLAQQLIKQMSGERQPKTVYNCQTALRALQRYLQEMHPEFGGRLPLRRLTPELIQGFQRYHLGRGVSENTIREYLRSLRSVVNRLRKHGKLGVYGALRHDIFNLVYTSPLSVSNPSLSEGDMRRLYAAEVKPGSSEELARDCLVFSYLAGGIPFADLARLKDDNYNPQTNELAYRRHKTGVTVRVQLTKEALKIWQRHAKTKDGLLQGTPGKDKLLQGTPGKDGLLQSTPGKDGLLQGTPGKDGLLQSTPGKDRLLQGTPGKDGLDSAAKSQGGGRPESRYHFGWIESADPAQADKEYHNALARYNRSLAKLTHRCGITTAVTSYTLRHTFASVARNEYNAGMHLISVPLGHRSERTTAIYISRIDSGQVYALQQKMERGLLR